VRSSGSEVQRRKASWGAPVVRRTYMVTAALCCMLSACTALTDPEVSGEPQTYTHIPSATRQDILKTASILFRDATGCERIEQIDISVKNIRMMFSEKILNGKNLQLLPSGGFLLDEQEIPPDNYVQENDELWQVAGCKTQRDFTVKIFGDDKGVTYFGVYDPEKHPAPEE